VENPAPQRPNPDHDWIIIALGHTTVVERVEVMGILVTDSLSRMLNIRVPCKIRFLVQNQGACGNFTARRPERSALGVHIANIPRIKFSRATQSWDEKTIFQGSHSF
jgi:hypothetical protein